MTRQRQYRTNSSLSATHLTQQVTGLQVAAVVSGRLGGRERRLDNVVRQTGVGEASYSHTTF